MQLIFGGNSDIAKQLLGVRLLRQQCDVTNFAQVQREIDRFEPTEIVHCAGVIHPDLIKNSNPLDWIEEIKVNLISSYYVAKANAKNKGKMVFIGSTSGLRGRGMWSGYSASKAGLISLVQSLGDEGYDAWCLNISRTDTKMRSRLFSNEDKSTLMTPVYVASVVEDCFKGKYPTGSSIIVKKDFIGIQ